MIEDGHSHEIRNTGRGLLKTVNIYLPPDYDTEGEKYGRRERGDRCVRPFV